MKRIAVTLLAAALLPFTFWLGGVDMTQRSPDLASCFIFTVIITVGAWVFSGEDEVGK